MAGGADGHSHLWAAFNNNGTGPMVGTISSPQGVSRASIQCLQYGAQNAASTTCILASDAFREYAINPAYHGGHLLPRCGTGPGRVGLR